ncbi:MAG TPA: hypothetical protein VFJ71_05425 [Candidatus Limnocylindrales bacterium]|nr:hypothetical protein [Candidatus Limnocylindrales bacterium]
MWKRARRAVVLVACLGLIGYVAIAAISIATFPPERFPPGPPQMGTRWDADTTLTKAAPIAVRAVRVVVDPTKDRITAPKLDLVVRGATGPDDPRAPASWLSIFDATTSSSTPNPAGTGHATLDGWTGSGRTFDDCETTRCAATYVLVARWLAPVDGPGVAVRFSSSLSATVIGGDSPWTEPSGPTPTPRLEGLALEEDLAFRFDGAPARRTVETSGSFRITPAAARVDQHLVLHVPAGLVDSRLHYPVLGRALLTVDRAESSARPAAPWVEITGPHGTARALAGIALDIDWLAGCEPAAPCDVPITVSGVFAPPPSYPVPTLAPDAWAEADWTLTAALERFDGEAPRSLDGMWLERVDR